MTASVRAILAAACVAIAPCMLAITEPPPADQPAGQPAGGPAADEAERIKTELERARTDMERRLKVIEEAQAMLKRGEALDSVREFLKSKNMNIMARMVDERRRGPAASPTGPRGLGIRDRSGGGGGRRDREGGPPPGEPRDGPPGGPPGPGGGPDRPPLFTVEERQVIRDVLRQIMPQRLDELDRIARDDPPEADRQFMKLMESPRIRGLLELRRSNPEAFRLRVDEFTAAAECNRRARALVELEAKKAPQERIDAERAALRAAAERLFDNRIKGLSAEVERLADRAASLRSELDEQNAHRADLINRSIEDAIERAKRPEGGPRPPRGGGDRPGTGPGGPGPGGGPGSR